MPASRVPRGQAGYNLSEKRRQDRDDFERRTSTAAVAAASLTGTRLGFMQGSFTDTTDSDGYLGWDLSAYTWTTEDGATADGDEITLDTDAFTRVQVATIIYQSGLPTDAAGEMWGYFSSGSPEYYPLHAFGTAARGSGIHLVTPEVYLDSFSLAVDAKLMAGDPSASTTVTTTITFRYV